MANCIFLQLRIIVSMISRDESDPLGTKFVNKSFKSYLWPKKNTIYVKIPIKCLIFLWITNWFQQIRSQIKAYSSCFLYKAFLTCLTIRNLIPFRSHLRDSSCTVLFLNVILTKKNWQGKSENKFKERWVNSLLVGKLGKGSNTPL